MTFLRQLIRFYGDSMQGLVPSYLEFTLERFTNEQQKFRQQFTDALGDSPIAAPTRHMFENIEEQTRKNMAMFQQALSMFSPFNALAMNGAAKTGEAPKPDAKSDEGQKTDIDTLKEQIADLQTKIETIAKR